MCTHVCVWAWCVCLPLSPPSFFPAPNSGSLALDHQVRRGWKSKSGRNLSSCATWCPQVERTNGKLSQITQREGCQLRAVMAVWGAPLAAPSLAQRCPGRSAGAKRGVAGVGIPGLRSPSLAAPLGGSGAKRSLQAEITTLQVTLWEPSLVLGASPPSRTAAAEVSVLLRAHTSLSN